MERNQSLRRGFCNSGRPPSLLRRSPLRARPPCNTSEGPAGTPSSALGAAADKYAAYDDLEASNLRDLEATGSGDVEGVRKVTIRPLTGPPLEVEAAAGMTIFELKVKLQGATGYTPAEVHLSAAGKRLANTAAVPTSAPLDLSVATAREEEALDATQLKKQNHFFNGK